MCSINRNLEHVNSLPVPTLEISENPLSLERAYAALADARSGGVALFVGRVREFNEGKEVRGLTYTAHPTALERLAEVVAHVSLRFTPLQIMAAHRTGDLALGEIAVICGVATVHRDDAFTACQLLIDTLKSGVPIWKEEFYVDGSAHWVGTP
ncbi:MAG: molybdenum cofactor biosynthesis protein MoaE [Actinobacteria bacterium]|nr:molybdenum cofactor biosynthesis protein MoaE [Actinomycetota bacterium]